MPQDSRHKEYLRYLPQWTRCRDAMAGADAIKGASAGLSLSPEPGHARLAGTMYLPRPSGMDALDYAAYMIRATWVNFSARVRQGLVGMIYREAPQVLAPPLVVAHLRDITRTGVSLAAFARETEQDHMTTGRTGILVDLPEGEQPANAVRPQWTLYRAEQIINWRKAVTPTGETIFTMVMLEEDVDAPNPADPYVHDTVTQWRELILEDGVYVVREWRKIMQPNGEGFQLVKERIPTRRGATLGFIPFAVRNGDSLESVIESPPLLDVVDVNLSHYRTNADYKHELHMTSLATAVITGWDNTNAIMKIGSLTAWIITEKDAKAYFLEVSGAGLAAKLDDMRAMEGQMAVLGARLLEPQRRSVEAAETHAIRQSAEMSMMEAYAGAASAVLTNVLRWHAWWSGVTERLDDESISVTLNTDFIPATLDAPTLTALVASWQAGALTQEDLYWNFSQGELLEPGVTYDDWAAKLETQAPAPLLALPAGMNGQGVPGGLDLAPGEDEV